MKVIKISEIEGYDENGNKIAIGVEKPSGESQGGIKAIMYKKDGANWIPYEGGEASYWDRDAVNGEIYPKTGTDKVLVDDINELTLNAGVSIESLNIKGTAISGAGNPYFTSGTGQDVMVGIVPHDGDGTDSTELTIFGVTGANQERMGIGWSASGKYIIDVRSDPGATNRPLEITTPNGAKLELDNDITVNGVVFNNDLMNCKYIDTPITKTLYVDKNRTDGYTEDGSINKPYKTINGAVTAIGVGNGEIIITAGIYAELVDCSGADCINIKGSGNTGSGTVLSGGFVGSIGTYSVVDVRIFGGTINNSSAYFTRCDLRGGLTLNHGTQLSNCDAETIEVNGADTVVVWISGSIGTGDNKAVVQNDGQLVLSHLGISNTSAGNETIDSDGGTLQIVNSIVVNYGGGSSIDINNAGNNSIMDSDVAGNADCHASSTRIEGLRFLSGSLSGSNFVLRPASRIDNDSSVTGDTVKDALESLVEKSTGWTGSFTNGDGATVTVVNGQIVSVA